MRTVQQHEFQVLAAELRRDLLSSMHTVYARLVFLSGLRDANSGTYEHFEVSARLGDDLCHRVLHAEHIHCYREWLAMSLEQQRADLMLYLVSVGLNRRQVLQTWLVTAPYRSLVPLHTQPVEQDVFFSDMIALLSVLMNEYGIAGPAGAA
jgi:hypothetical protein